MTFHLTCVQIVFSWVWVAEWRTFGIGLLTRLTICSLCILFVILVIPYRYLVLSPCRVYLGNLSGRGSVSWYDVGILFRSHMHISVKV